MKFRYGTQRRRVLGLEEMAADTQRRYGTTSVRIVDGGDGNALHEQVCLTSFLSHDLTTMIKKFTVSHLRSSLTGTHSPWYWGMVQEWSMRFG